MPIGSSNISLKSTIADEFIGTTSSAVSLSSYYRNKVNSGDVYVPSRLGTSDINASIPESGAISFSDFSNTGVAGSSTPSLSWTLDQSPMYWAGNGQKGDVWPMNYAIFPGNAYDTNRTAFRGSLTSTNPCYKMKAGANYAYITCTGADGSFGTRYVTGLGTNVSKPSKGGNGGRGITDLASNTFQNLKNNNTTGLNQAGSSNASYVHWQAVRNNAQYKTISGRTNPSSLIQFTSGQIGGSEDPGKGGVAVFIWPKYQLKRIFEKLGITFNSTADITA